MGTGTVVNGVVELKDLGGGVAQVRLQDQRSKNTFTPELVQGILEAFRRAQADPGTRVVLLVGTERYFCCGGTQAELLEMAAGQVEFSSFEFYDQCWRCSLPVVAGVSGHAIGGGLVFAAYADLMILGEESIYSANFMQYGFTPGLGATCLLPKKIGLVLGTEMLMTGRNYLGTELKQRGAALPIVPRVEVEAAALQMARELAEKPRVALCRLKRALNEAWEGELKRAVAIELEMHRETFVLPEVRERITGIYRGGTNSS
jgi:polyketide biosynthesis enoyl-CoA hydratase PksI